jgi:hypothetical protein
MTIAVGTKHTGKWELVRGHYLAAALGAAVLVGTLVGVGAWQAIGDSTAEKPAPATGAVYVSRDVEPTPTFYIVADEAQAQKVLRGEDDAAQMRAAGGNFEQVDDVQVLVANDMAQLDMMLIDIANANNIRGQDGLRLMPVIDLR